MISETVIELSCWQFGITILFHFIFIPLTVGLAFFLAILESLYVLTGRDIYQKSCLFWSRFFTISFALGFASRLILISQFGMNASYFSQYAGDVFAVPLAIEALTSFFPVFALFGAYSFGWERCSKSQHLMITWFICLAINLSTWWALTSYCWMQNPVGGSFNYESFRIELNDISQLLLNPLIITKLIHNVAAEYATAAATILAISAYLLLKNPADALAKCSFKPATVLGLVATLAICAGDNTPYQDSPTQIHKLAAINGDNFAKFLPEIKTHIRNGIKAYSLLQELRDESKNPQVRSDFNDLKSDLGYALLLEKINPHITEANDKQIDQAAQFSLPNHPALILWCFRIMIAGGIIYLALFVTAIAYGFNQKPLQTWLLKLSYYLLPFSWLAYFSGWLIAELGKQPWAIAEILPAAMSISSLSVKELLLSIGIYSILYCALAFIGIFLSREIIQKHILDLSQKTI
jgi:cytochrome d ubiquinol oxidase subunit I